MKKTVAAHPGLHPPPEDGYEVRGYAEDGSPIYGPVLPIEDSDALSYTAPA